MLALIALLLTQPVHAKDCKFPIELAEAFKGDETVAEEVAIDPDTCAYFENLNRTLMVNGDSPLDRVEILSLKRFESDGYGKSVYRLEFGFHEENGDANGFGRQKPYELYAIERFRQEDRGPLKGSRYRTSHSKLDFIN